MRPEHGDPRELGAAVAADGEVGEERGVLHVVEFAIREAVQIQGVIAFHAGSNDDRPALFTSYVEVVAAVRAALTGIG